MQRIINICVGLKNFRSGDRANLPNQTKLEDDYLAHTMSIIKLIGINQYILAVFYTSFDCYKYSIIDDYGAVYEPDDIFYTSEAAEREGRETMIVSQKLRYGSRKC